MITQARLLTRSGDTTATRTILLTALGILVVCALFAVCVIVGGVLSGLDKVAQQIGRLSARFTCYPAGPPDARQFSSQLSNFHALCRRYSLLPHPTVLLLPNPMIPASVARSHFWETLGFSLVFGALAGWLLCRTAHAPQVEPT